MRKWKQCFAAVFVCGVSDKCLISLFDASRDNNKRQKVLVYDLVV